MSSRPNWIFVLITQLGSQRKQVAAMDKAGSPPWDRGFAKPMADPLYGMFEQRPASWRPVAGATRREGRWVGQRGREYQLDDPYRQGRRQPSWGNQARVEDWRDTRRVAGCMCGRRGCPGA